MHGFALAAATLVCLTGAILTPAPPPKIVTPAIEAADIGRLAMGLTWGPAIAARLG